MFKYPPSKINKYKKVWAGRHGNTYVVYQGHFCLLASMNFIPAVIDEEWQRTQCSPRETCVEVASELGKTTNTFFKPPCVNVFRCGGCCNEESVMCMNTSTSYISKQVQGNEDAAAGLVTKRLS